ncbi:MAG: hypothetical protein IH978_09285, partial [Nitrospinae bacterium]|nr:hypothetical protein [Nitrospinota bacterium]
EIDRCHHSPESIYRLCAFLGFEQKEPGPLELLVDDFKSLLDTQSCLGGTTVEGVVVKNYALWTMEKKIAIGKYVSEIFKERNSKEWKIKSPT